MIDDAELDRARAAVEHERAAAGAKADAFEGFVDRVSDLPTSEQPSAPESGSHSGGSVVAPTSTAGSCRAVRAAFAETVRPESVADVDDSEPLLATIRAELNDHVASALSQSSDTAFSPQLKEAILRESAARIAEIQVFRDLLTTEREHLDDAHALVADVTEWVTSADQTPLTDLGFDALAHRHEGLAAHRDRCAQRLRERQQFLDGETAASGASFSHRGVVTWVYGDCSVTYPVLDAVLRLEAACTDCQRRVRQHLTRRV
jgi:hypothetical protein